MNFKPITLAALLLCSPVAYAEQQVPMYQAGQAQFNGAQLDQAWVRVATAQLQNLVNGSAQNIASSIQGTTHPTGNSARLAGYNVLNLGDRLMVQLTVSWQGGFMGGGYQTSVNWELTPESHLSAKVVGDTANVAVAEPNKQALDNYFRQSVYPVFYSNMKGVGY